MAVTTKDHDHEKGEKKTLSQASVVKPQLPEFIAEADMAPEQMEEAYANSFNSITEGEVVKGTVLKVTENHVVIDVGFKSEGVVSLHEFRGEEGVASLQPGETVEVLLERAEGKDGRVLLSREKAERMKIWDTIEVAYQNKSLVKGRVIERIKGGLAVDIIGVRAFLPGSQVDLHPVRNLDSLRGEELEMRVIKVNKRRGNIVLSRKAVLEEVYFKQKEETLKRLEEGLIIAGVVKNITDYGAFVDLGGIDGLLHITDMSWGRVNHPSDLFNVADKVNVKILKFDLVEEKVSLGYKQLAEDPWLSAAKRYPKSSRVDAKVVSLTDYGAFVELEEGVEGLIHISEMTWNKRIKHPSQLLKMGETIQAEVLELDTSARRISLGLKQTEPNPWDAIEAKYGINSVVSGEVRNMTDFGAFIEVEEGVDGLVHVSDMSWTKKIRHPSEVLEKGEKVTAIVLSVDASNQRLSLGIKQLEPDQWEEFFEGKQVGDVLPGKIVRMANFGAFVELEGGIEGLCHVSELDKDHIENAEDRFSVDQEFDFKIIKLNLLERKIGLSIRALQEPDREFNDRKSSKSSWSYTPEVATTSIGEIAGDELDELKKRAEIPREDADDES
jgi:small subunit ribosomal protein S1